MIYDAGIAQNDEIIGKIKQMIQNGCQQILLTDLFTSIEDEQDESERVYKARVVGVKSE